MAEPTTSRSFLYLYETVGRRFYGLAAKNLMSAAQQTEAKLIANEALAMFYQEYDWSFLSPDAVVRVRPTLPGTAVLVPTYSSTTGVSTLTVSTAICVPEMVGSSVEFDTSGNTYYIVSYSSTTGIGLEGDASGEKSADTLTFNTGGFVRLPDDFGYMITDFGYTPGEAERRLKRISVEELRDLRSESDASTELPVYYAICPVVPATTTGNRFYALFYPQFTDAKTLNYKYKVGTQDYATDTDIPHGMPLHAPTIIQAIKMQIETWKGEVMGTEFDLYKKVYLPNSVRLENYTRPRNLGQMLERSDELQSYPNRTEVNVELTP